MSSDPSDELLRAIREFGEGQRKILRDLVEANARLLEHLDAMFEKMSAQHRETRAEILALAGISPETWSRVYRAMQAAERGQGQEAVHG